MCVWFALAPGGGAVTRGVCSDSLVIFGNVSRVVDDRTLACVFGVVESTLHIP